jgi:secreted Zn-dependent insulinase-like peptidase
MQSATEKNSLCSVNYQIGNKEKERACMAWLETYIKPKFFAELRTKQQLGICLYLQK